MAETAQIIEPARLKKSSLADLLEILIISVRKDERKTSGTKRRNIKKILTEITRRTKLPQGTANAIIERDS